MASFGFDEKFAMFGSTPVENRFILELMPAAKGDYVRVYLYGLLQCYHPEGKIDPEKMAAELKMSPEEVCAAFRYWERQQAVRRVSDHPPEWKYLSLIQQAMNGETAGGDDPEYTSFVNAICEVFDNERRLHGSETATCFEWHEDLGLPIEAVIMLLKHMASIKGKQFKIKDAEKIAMEMAAEKITTEEAAAEFLARDRLIYDGVRRVLRKLGKKYAPSEAQTAMYRKWIREWHFTPEAVEAALEQTAGGDPSMGYLDAILAGIRSGIGEKEEVQAGAVIDSAKRRKELQEILKALGRGTVNSESLKVYEEMCGMYPRTILMTAARECRGAGRDLNDVAELLRSWKKRGLETEEDVRAHLDVFHAQTLLLKELQKLWGTADTTESRVRRNYIQKWTQEWGMSRELILKAGEYAATAREPMAYLDRILSSYREKGIRTPQEAELEHAKAARTDGKGGSSQKGKLKQVVAQQYTQRDYSDREAEALARMIEMNGGLSDDA